MTRGMLAFSSGFSGVQPDEIVLVGASGREAMSTIYEYELTLEVHRDGGLPADQIDGLLSNTCYILAQGAGSVEVHGMLRGITLLAANEATPVAYRAYLVPIFWNTTRVFRTRIFQDMNVQDIVDKVLSDHGIEADWWLTGTYPASEYTVQYEETDFNFISRMLEHYGIYYFFRQEPDGEVLVIGDTPNAFESHPEFPIATFNPNMGRSGVKGCVHSISTVWLSQTAGITVREYNWRTPLAALAAQEMADTYSGYGVHWCYGEHFKDNDEGAMIAKIRAEQELNQREEYSGICSIPGLRPGQKFELSDCTIPDLNITYLVTEVAPVVSTSLVGDEFTDSYQFPFSAVALERDEPTPVPYRSQRLARKPVIHGFMHGIVDGEAATTAAPIDSDGRYRIVMPMDSVGELGGKATRWIRMMQASSGGNYGIHFPLHMGTEVAIIHLDGDPDRPLILGTPPNKSTTSPIVQGEATRSRIRTRSGIEFEFEDDA